MNSDVERIKFCRQLFRKPRLLFALLAFERVRDVKIGNVLMKRQELVKRPMRVFVHENEVTRT